MSLKTCRPTYRTNKSNNRPQFHHILFSKSNATEYSWMNRFKCTNKSLHTIICVCHWNTVYCRPSGWYIQHKTQRSCISIQHFMRQTIVIFTVPIWRWWCRQTCLQNHIIITKNMNPSVQWTCFDEAYKNKYILCHAVPQMAA